MSARPELTLYLLLKHRCTHFNTQAHICTHAHAFTVTYGTSSHTHTHTHTQTYTDTHTRSPSTCTTLQGFRTGWRYWVLWAESIYLLRLRPTLPFFQPPHTPPLLAPLQYGLSTSLLSVRQRYQAKNVSGVDSRHEGTGASTSASEPAGWGIHSSGQVNTAALWNATLSYNKCVCVCVCVCVRERERVSVDVNKGFIKTTLTYECKDMQNWHLIHVLIFEKMWYLKKVRNILFHLHEYNFKILLNTHKWMSIHKKNLSKWLYWKIKETDYLKLTK